MSTSRIYTVRHSGVRRGWFVLSTSPRDRIDVRTAAGPYTTRAQAEARAAELRAAR